ncbi:MULTISPECIES: glycosyltransferase [unclassified Leifsonia]|uniref:glycosyltransferase n=1 Tax=unclassified Leifsonia TaxID=2663824 RepID=UPI0008A750EB|nr:MULTISPECIES: glycosyltransferase [unclassified Leifsonia]SEH85478.1 Glycosyltransferase involved in cell wall bisynthesis [Leifsonia sp. CL154]SFL47981.1 Glycosyltransferase involved in cell wall bisynthesis [Leifsonia sp. CL147]
MPDSSGPHPTSSAPAAKQPLTIVMGCDTFAPDVNGAARFAERLAAGLVEHGHDVHIVAPAASRRHGTWVEEHQGQKMTVHRLRSWRWYPHDWLRFALPWTSKANARRVLDQVKPDVVHIQSHIVVGRGLAAEAEKRGIRIVATNHVMAENVVEFTLLPKFLQKTFVKLAWADARPTFDRAEAVTTPTRKAAEFLERSTGLRDIHAVSCGIDAHNYTPDFTPRTANRILFVGRITGEKHIDVLLKAMKLLPATLDAHLQIVGGGDQLKNLQTMAETTGITDRVEFLGYVSDQQLREAYSRATVFAMPSIAELQSIATMEAMASALPVVAADAMALPHLVHDGENGYLFRPGDAQDLADKLERVLTMPQEELDVLKHGSLRIVAAHDIQTTISTFESLYRGEPVADPVTDAAPSVPAPE